MPMPDYQRQHIGLTGGSTQGMLNASNVMGAAQSKYIQSIAATANEGAKLANTVADIYQQRYARDAKTTASEAFRLRKLEQFSTRRGADADGILNDETEWSQAAKDKFIAESKLPAAAAGNIWDQQADQYLNSVGAYALQQGVIAEDESKYAAMINSQDELSLSEVGDFAAFADYSYNVNELFGIDTKESVAYKHAGLETMVNAWAAQDPETTLTWYNNNKELIRDTLRREFPNVDQAMDRLQAKLDAAIRREEVNAQRQQRLADAEQKRRDNEWFAEQVGAIANDEDIDITKTIAEGRASGISGDTLNKFFYAADRRERTDAKRVQSGLMSIYFSRAIAGEFTPDDNTSCIDHVANGKLTPEQYNRIQQVLKQDATREAQGLKEPYKRAVQHLKTAIAPRGGMEFINQKAEWQFEALEGQLATYIESLPSYSAKVKELNINDPNSFISQLIRANAEGNTPLTRMTEGLSMGPLDFDYEPTIPGKPYAPLPDNDMRKDGETIDDWLKRTGRRN